ncbi:FMN-dependent NADH-azoreductase [Thiorhodococcus minor]|uniref:FMN dependent NADH:quinone oxidoreductase n=1 Tax=Thiorhodococcus minor TaxID=57489 RepID=A0A6M0K2R8_9GAMM|nr:NAD(P)H-dependent oxidoreductase [Thiorhodococcus minor]NEV62615.1 FMN-dependent NADH-azoreductase [Thiorhodococcus minor]
MTKVLHIDSSLFSGEGVSSLLAGRYVARLREQDPTIEVLHRDLAADPIPHLDLKRLQAIGTPEAERTPEQRAIAAEADQLIAELQEADLLVLGVPMYNFAVPSQLKAWIDHVARAGVTFRYTADGPVGLLEGKRVVIVTSRGGFHRGQETDTQIDHIRTTLGLLGLTEIEVIYAEGLNLGEEQRAASIRKATEALQRLAAA